MLAVHEMKHVEYILEIIILRVMGQKYTYIIILWVKNAPTLLFFVFFLCLTNHCSLCLLKLSLSLIKTDPDSQLSKYLFPIDKPDVCKSTQHRGMF